MKEIANTSFNMPSSVLLASDETMKTLRAQSRALRTRVRGLSKDYISTLQIYSNSMKVLNNESQERVNKLSHIGGIMSVVHQEQNGRLSYNTSRLLQDLALYSREVLKIFDISSGNSWFPLLFAKNKGFMKTADDCTENYKKHLTIVFELINIYVHINSMWKRLPVYNSDSERVWLRSVMDDEEFVSIHDSLNKRIQIINEGRGYDLQHLPLIMLLGEN